MNAIDRLNAIKNGWTPEPKEQIFKTISEDGTIEYKNAKGELHNIDDMPAIIYKDTHKHWFKNGKCHRDNDKPAIVNDYGYQAWYQNSKRHRDNGKPAIIWPDGTEEYWINGERVK